MKSSIFVNKFTIFSIFLIFTTLLFLFLFKEYASIKPVHSQETNSTVIVQKLLIVSSSSPFKDSIAMRILDHYQSSYIDVDVIDVRTLTPINSQDFDAILIMHRWEAGAPPDNVQAFMDKNSESKNKIVMLTTSWYGLEKMEAIDAITGASIVHDAPVFTDRIIKRLDGLLNDPKKL